jgi:16S rRNA C967 or C1407 C5-methylase (RsmB/RsmF family)
VVYLLDARQTSKLGVKFDRVLLDVPCSGNFASDRNWFRNRTLKDVERNATLQREILTHAVECLSDGGEIVYSTCSLEPEEDELNIDWAIKNLNLQPNRSTAMKLGLPTFCNNLTSGSIVAALAIRKPKDFVCKLKTEPQP